MTLSTDLKVEKIKQMLQEMGSVLVAYSGGVDSTLMLKLAHDALGEKALGVIAVSASMPQRERLEALQTARQIGARVEEISSAETADERYLANTPERCYFCKSNVYDHMLAYAQQHGYRAIVDGTNADDVGDHRPGRQAARQRGVRSPLLECGMTKAEIRALARAYGLPNWDKPAAACLASRVPYGMAISLPVLNQIEQAEEELRRLGFRQVRVRHHDQIARIEVEPSDFSRLIEQRQAVIDAFRALGYAYVTLDLAGFRSGSMNEALLANGRLQTA